MGRLRMNRNVFEALNVQARILKTLFESPRRSRSQNYFDVYFCSFELHTFETSPPSVDFLSFSISAFLDTRERENRTQRGRERVRERAVLSNKFEDLRTKAEYGMERAQSRG